jgi:hypothetical protein
LVAGTCRASSASTASTSSGAGVTSTEAASGSCSAWLIRSAATCTGSAVASARIAISVGPASASMPTRPCSSRLAAVTQMLPGPVITSTGAQRSDSSAPSEPYPSMAIAWAPPTA